MLFVSRCRRTDTIFGGITFQIQNAPVTTNNLLVTFSCHDLSQEKL